ncbi:DNA primase [Mesorhizobium sp. Z1-4]|uniref:DNA primase n=1 Tax=Mesorhizobium sp. Z1-4 TaxID=2448478 RepID=UPI000FDA1BC8|nr:DNA primase [Mesorhizobium sp. Z1-4]
MRFSDTFLDEIRARLPISAVVGTRVTWDKKKTNASRGDYWACCPFHGEKTPSFHADDRRGRYHCFGCGVSGDHFRFLTELDGMSFPEAVERVADQAGVPMPARDPQAERREKEKASLTEVMELATGFFQETLQAADGAKARAYLRDRGITSVTQQTFRLGYAPDSRNALKEFLASKGIEKAQMEACGLTVFENVPVSYDRFRDRIMFPIEDSRGRVIAFGGRAMSADIPAKYMNSPETELFHKGNVLYNFARARKTLGRDETVIVAEGYMDVIGLAQAGFEHGVAPLGTALTENQLELLWRMTKEPLLCFDGDQAGLRAAFRAAELALPMIAPGRTLRFVIMPEGKDPDDLVRESGPEAFQALINEARSLADMLWLRETSGGVFDTPERRADLEKRLRLLTATIRDESVRYHYSQDMRERAQAFFGARREPANQRGDKRAFGQGGRGQASGRMPVSDRLAHSALVRSAGPVMPLREATIVVALANHAALLDAYFDQAASMDLEHPELRQLLAALLDIVATGEPHGPDEVAARFEARGLAETWSRAVLLVKGAHQWPALADATLDDAREAFVQALHLQRSSGFLNKELKAAELALATDPTEENYRRLVEIQAHIRDAQSTEALIEGFGVTSGRVARG